MVSIILIAWTLVLSAFSAWTPGSMRSDCHVDWQQRLGRLQLLGLVYNGAKLDT